MTTARLDHVRNSEKAASEKNEEKVLREEKNRRTEWPEMLVFVYFRL